ncbi:hypothetical protein [Treponema pectinovorum]|uniref:hypothetical protein n=1 Tax=Treponema pectinovorum TaxID=164 RepID=UPI0011CC514E|nr:hypothetical protein [Treponema pectinovorum]
MNELVTSRATLTPQQAFPFQQEIDTWTLEEAVVQIKPKVEQLKTVSLEVARALFIAHQALAQRGGDRRSEDAQTSGFCDFLSLVGLSKKTAYLWLKLYSPQEDRVRDPEELRLEKSANPQIADDERESRLAHAMATGERLAGWTQIDEAEYKRRKQNEHFSEMARKWGSKKIKTNWKNNDYFSDAMRNAKQYARISFTSKEQTLAQFEIFEQISDYLKTFEDPSERLTAAYNLGLRVREVVNEMAAMQSELNSFDTVEYTGD